MSVEKSDAQKSVYFSLIHVFSFFLFEVNKIIFREIFGVNMLLEDILLKGTQC